MLLNFVHISIFIMFLVQEQHGNTLPPILRIPPPLQGWVPLTSDRHRHLESHPTPWENPHYLPKEAKCVIDVVGRHIQCIHTDMTQHCLSSFVSSLSKHFQYEWGKYTVAVAIHQTRVCALVQTWHSNVSFCLWQFGSIWAELRRAGIQSEDKIRDEPQRISEDIFPPTIRGRPAVISV